MNLASLADSDYMLLAGTEIFVRDHACMRAEMFLGRFLINGDRFFRTFRQLNYSLNARYLYDISQCLIFVRYLPRFCIARI